MEIDAHYLGYLKRQSHDIEAFKKDESIAIPDDINYDSFSGLSAEIKSKLNLIKPKTLGQALRIDAGPMGGGPMQTGAHGNARGNP